MNRLRSLSLFSVVVAIVLGLFSLDGCIEPEINIPCTADCITINGRFTTGDGTEPLANHKVGFSWLGGFVIFGPSSREVVETQTDDQGYYTMSFNLTKTELQGSLFIWSAHDERVLQEYHDDGDKVLFQIDSLAVNATFQKNYFLPKNGGSLRVRIKNPNSIPGPTHLSYMAWVHRGELSEPRSISVTNFTTGDYSEKTWKTAANAYTYIRVWRTINGENTTALDSVYVRDQQEVLYEIEY